MGRFKDGKFAEFKRRAILDAATAEFTAKGLDKASMRAIASAAGMTTGAIYTMFEGKEDIYAALLSESLSRLKTYMVEQTAKAESPEEAVRASVVKSGRCWMIYSGVRALRSSHGDRFGPRIRGRAPL